MREGSKKGPEKVQEGFRKGSERVKKGSRKGPERVPGRVWEGSMKGRRGVWEGMDLTITLEGGKPAKLDLSLAELGTALLRSHIPSRLG